MLSWRARTQFMSFKYPSVKLRAKHHDTHALPPQFIQDVYKHYRDVKRTALDNDAEIIDFHRGLSESQRQVLQPVAKISAHDIYNACHSYRDSLEQSFANPTENTVEFKDVTIYEHKDFPGLQIAPGLLPPETQILFVSQILHHSLADPGHKTNIQADYDLVYPPSSTPEQASLFNLSPAEIHFKPKAKGQEPLSMVQLLSKKLRWLTIGTQYDWPTRSYSRRDSTSFPGNLAHLVAGLFPHIRSESGVCLIYGGKDYMPVHRDVSEQCERALASFSFGCDGVFLVARGEEEIDDPEERKKRVVAIRVHSGDCVHMDGETRWAWHAMARTLPNTCPKYLANWPVATGVTANSEKAFEKWKGFLGSKRLNVSCRQVWD